MKLSTVAGVCSRSSSRTMSPMEVWIVAVGVAVAALATKAVLIDTNANPERKNSLMRIPSAFRLRILYPIGNEDVGASRCRTVTIGFPDELLPIGAEHREAVEILVEGDLLLAGAVAVDDEEIEIPAMGIVHVGGEDDPLPVGYEIGREIRRAVEGDLFLLRAVRLHDEQFHFGRHYQILGEEILVAFDLLWRFRTVRAPY